MENRNPALGKIFRFDFIPNSQESKHTQRELKISTKENSGETVVSDGSSHVTVIKMEGLKCNLNIKMIL